MAKNGADVLMVTQLSIFTADRKPVRDQLSILRRMAVCPTCKCKPVLLWRGTHKARCPICGREASAADTEKLIEVWNETNSE